MPIQPKKSDGKQLPLTVRHFQENLHNRAFDSVHVEFAEQDTQNNEEVCDKTRSNLYKSDERPVFDYENLDFANRRKLGKYVPESTNNTQNENADLIELSDFFSIDKAIDNDDGIRCAFPDESELVHRHHRTTSIHRNATFKNINDLSSRGIPKSLEERRHWMAPAGNKKQTGVTEVQEHTDNIITRMQQDGVLMEDSPESELLRREALRDMPQCLTVKRIIKKKLKSSVSQHSKFNPLSCTKRLKYYISMKFTKMQNSLKSIRYTFELWYSSLKKIEGHFGSGIATYFRFMRWLFITNLLIAVCAIGFVVLPQLLYIYVRPVNTETNNTYTSDAFKLQNIFDGEGYFTNTILYYGSYTTQDVVLVPNYIYNMPYAYFLTMIVLYFSSFCVLSTSMATSYRKSFIETQGGLKNVFAHKIFCGWDYGIATEEAANLKSSFIYHELMELIGDAEKSQPRQHFWKKLWTCTVQVMVNIFIAILLVGIGYVMWFLLEKHSFKSDAKEMSSNIGIVTAVLINMIMIVFPTIFGIVIRYEDYKHPRAALYITLIRTFLLKSVVVGVFLGFWLTHSEDEECWETSIGQHIYRLILFDFLFSLVLGTVVHVTRYIIYKKYSKMFNLPEFDIAQHTLQLMYNQTLFWVGFYFSPVLSLIVVIKLWCTWYLKRTFVLCICKPSSKAWRAAQTQTVFLILSFLSLLLVVIAHGYIIVGVKTSNCGPMKEYPYMYEMIIRDMFKLEHNHKFWKVLLYLRKPGTVTLIFIAMSVIVYYLRAKATAQKNVVNILRDMLVLEAKDKEFLLAYIAKVTDGKWQNNLERRTTETWNAFENAAEFNTDANKPKYKEDFGDTGTSSGSSVVLLK